MPNWITNKVEVIGKGQDIVELRNLMHTDDNFQFDFQKILPMPEELSDTTSPYQGTPEESKRLKEKYGANDWYSWSIENWGTKWNASEVTYSEVTKMDDGRFIMDITFDTAWSVPAPFMLALGKRFDKCHFKGMYADEDLGSNYGEYEIENGQPLFFCCYEYEDLCNGTKAREVLFECKPYAEDAWNEKTCEFDWSLYG